MYYDIIYSLDDGGWYCQCYDEHGNEHFVTDVYQTEKQAEQAVLDMYKNPVKIKTIT